MSNDARARGPAEPGRAMEFSFGLKIGRELFRASDPAGGRVTFVCYEDGYALRRDGQPLPGCRWDADGVEAAMDAFQAMTSFRQRRPAAPPAA